MTYEDVFLVLGVRFDAQDANLPEESHRPPRLVVRRQIHDVAAVLQTDSHPHATPRSHRSAHHGAGRQGGPDRSPPAALGTLSRAPVGGGRFLPRSHPERGVFTGTLTSMSAQRCSAHQRRCRHHATTATSAAHFHVKQLHAQLLCLPSAMHMYAQRTCKLNGYKARAHLQSWSLACCTLCAAAVGRSPRGRTLPPTAGVRICPGKATHIRKG